MQNRFSSIFQHKIAWFALLIILVFAGSIRYGLLDLPLERDEGEYAYAGQLILQGIPPYQEVYNMKLPGIYAAYACILAIFGESHQGIHAALLIINLITIIAIFFLAKHLADNLCAIVASATFALLSLSQSVQGEFANAEHFVVLFVAVGLLVMLQGIAKASLLRLFYAGLLLGLGGIMKQHGTAFILLAVLYILFNSLKDSSVNWRLTAIRILTFTVGVVTVFGILFLTMLWIGVFKQFWFWIFDYASAYVSQIPLKDALWIFHSNFIPIINSAPLLWIISGVGFLMFAINNISEDHKVFLFMYALFSLLSISPGFYFRPHYFILILPCAALFAGMAVSLLADFLSKFFSGKIQFSIPAILMIVCCSLSIYQQRNFLFEMTPFEGMRSTYWLNPFSESLEIAEFIQKRTNPDDRVAVLGSEPQIFFYSKRRSASGYIYMYPLMENHRFALQMQKDFINDVEKAKPKIMVYVGVSASWLESRNSHKEIFQWFDRYLKNSRFSLVGVVELFENKSVYHWDTDVKWPVNSPCWVAIFERQ